ncbi:MAG: murein hydrolase activator EnvC family protein, partial [Chitinophagales bacterium]
MKGKYLTAILLVIVFMASIVLPVTAGKLEDTQKELKTLNQQITQQEKRVNTAKKKEKTISGQIQRLENEMYKTQREINRLDNQVNTLEGNIRLTQSDIEKAEVHLAERTAALNTRLVKLYEAGEISYFEVLLSSSDFNDFLTRWDLMTNIFNQDQELIASISAERDELANKKVSLQNTKTQLIVVQDEK